MLIRVHNPEILLKALTPKIKRSPIALRKRVVSCRERIIRKELENAIINMRFIEALCLKSVLT